MRRSRQIFWLLKTLEPKHHGRALLLKPHGFNVRFFTSIAELIGEAQKKRTGIIFISDNDNEFDICNNIDRLGNLPESRNARLMLITENEHEDAKKLAASYNFRDIIPLEIDDKSWIQRVAYSSGNKPVPFVQPAGQISMNNISALYLPSRIVWMSDERIRIECRLKPPVGANLKLSGDFPDELGVDYISLHVEETHNTHLQYRFSDAIVASWSTTQEGREKFKKLVWERRKKDKGPTNRVFVAAKEPNMRSKLLSFLDRPDFAVSSALQLQSLVTEPKYFTPNMIFIEDILTQGPHEDRFKQMLQTVKSNVPVIIIGSHLNSDTLKEKYPNNRLLLLKKVSDTFETNVLEKILQSISEEKGTSDLGAIHFPQTDPTSHAEVSIPARLMQLHPKVAHFTIPYKVEKFGLARLESPVIRKLIGKNPWVKITETYRNHREHAAPFVYSSESFIADINRNEKTILAEGLSGIIQGHFDKYTEEQNSDQKNLNPFDRTPELGSLRHKKAIPFPVRPPQVAKKVNNPYFQHGSTAVAINAQELGKAGEQKGEDQLAINQNIEMEPMTSSMHEIEIVGAQNIQEIKEKAKDVVQHVYENLNKPKVRLSLLFVSLSGFLLAVVVSLFYYLAKDYVKSGNEFTRSLYKYAPQLKEPKGPPKFFQKTPIKKTDPKK